MQTVVLIISAFCKVSLIAVTLIIVPLNFHYINGSSIKFLGQNPDHNMWRSESKSQLKFSTL